MPSGIYKHKKRNKETIRKLRAGPNSGWFKEGKRNGIKTEFKKGHPKPKNAFKFKKGHKGYGNGWPKGKPRSQKTIDKIKKSLSKINRKRENSPSWIGGKSFEPYGLEFNENLREVIRNRDRRKCMICGKTELENRAKLICHHIDYNKRNNNPDNLISLCRSCHAKTNFNRNYWMKYFKKHYGK